MYCGLQNIQDHTAQRGTCKIFVDPNHTWAGPKARGGLNGQKGLRQVQKSPFLGFRHMARVFRILRGGIYSLYPSDPLTRMCGPKYVPYLLISSQGIKYLLQTSLHMKSMWMHKTYYSPLKNTWHFLMNELLLLKKFIISERFSYIINFFNSNNSFLKKCQVFFNGHSNVTHKYKHF